MRQSSFILNEVQVKSGNAFPSLTVDLNSTAWVMYVSSDEDEMQDIKHFE